MLKKAEDMDQDAKERKIDHYFIRSIFDSKINSISSSKLNEKSRNKNSKKSSKKPELSREKIIKIKIKKI